MRYLHTMVRVADVEASLDFYCTKLGLEEMRRIDNENGRFTLIFLAAPKDKATSASSRAPELELTHNWGTENDEEFGYHNGNDEPQGFGHIGVAVPDVYSACDRFEKLGVDFVKKPDDGKMKGLAFIKDPDGYWIEILQPNMLEKQRRVEEEE